jgi:hypothetical protein
MSTMPPDDQDSNLGEVGPLAEIRPGGQPVASRAGLSIDLERAVLA